MLPDEPAGIGGIVAAAARRGRVMALVEAAAWGGAVAALWPVLGSFAAAAVAAWRWRTTRRESIVRALERAQPAARNLFVTADELERDALAAKPAIRGARARRRRGGRAQSSRRADLFPAAPIARAVAAVVVAWAVATAVPWWRAASHSGASSSAAQTASRTSGGPASLRVTVVVQPPPYTGSGADDPVDPEQIQAVEGATAVVTIESTSRSISLEQDGQVRPLDRERRIVQRSHRAESHRIPPGRR